jgi:hypothetical protein
LENRAIRLGDFKDNTGKYVNPNYYGKTINKLKNTITFFLIPGRLSIKDLSELFALLKTIFNEGMDFNITIAGYNRDNFNIESLKIPEEIKERVKIKTNLNFEEFYKEVENSDFILPVLENVDRYGYLKNQVSGNINLCYGFLKPIVIEKSYRKLYKFNNSNSILYEFGKLYDAIKVAILTNQKEYSVLQKNLKITVEKIRGESMNNLKNILCVK